MQLVLASILCFVATLFAATSIRGLSRVKRLQDRLDGICGPAGQDGIEKGDAAIAVARAADILAVPGLDPDSLAGRTYVVLSLSALLVLTVLAGWKVGMAAAIFGLVGHLVMARWRKRKLEQEFADELPAFLERVRRLILIGKTLPHAFVETVATANPVLRRDMDPIVRRIRLGAPFSDCIDMLARQIDIIELHMLAAYVRTNVKFGGRVAQTLVNLISLLSNRRRLEREIKAATAETRASAAILFGLMALTMIAMSVMNPEYLRFYLDTDTGRLILFGIIGWPVLGAIVMRRILVLDF